jgi:protease-4
MAKPKIISILKGIAIAGFIIASFIIIRNDIVWRFDSGETNAEGQEYCPVMGVELYSELTTYRTSPEIAEDGSKLGSSDSDYVVRAIKDMDNNETVRAIILTVDSGGGSGVAGEEIANALKNAKKPTVVLIRDEAASAAYWAATGADYIIASVISYVGSIGVTASYLDYTKQNLKDGITYIELNSAKFKNSGDPNKPLTAEEKMIWQRDLNITHQYFVQQVAANRKLEVDKVSKLADGSTMLGQMALDNGLIDKIGGINDVLQYFIDKGAITEKQDVCWYQ